MKIILDENIPLDTVLILQEKGIDVLSVAKQYAGSSDREIVKLAIETQRLIVTFDRDFGQLIFKEGLKPPRGVLYLRLSQIQPKSLAELILSLLISSSITFDNNITVVGDNFIRQRLFK